MKMPDGAFVHPLFGSVRFRTAHSTWVRGDSITFLGGFDTGDIQPVTVPRLANVPASNHGRLVPLPRLTAIAGLGMDFDNDAKVVKLSRIA
jgi:hypothetical protein